MRLVCWFIVWKLCRLVLRFFLMNRWWFWVIFWWVCCLCVLDGLFLLMMLYSLCWYLMVWDLLCCLVCRFLRMCSSRVFILIRFWCVCMVGMVRLFCLSVLMVVVFWLNCIFCLLMVCVRVIRFGLLLMFLNGWKWKVVLIVWFFMILLLSCLIRSCFLIVCVVVWDGSRYMVCCW